MLRSQVLLVAEVSTDGATDSVVHYSGKRVEGNLERHAMRDLHVGYLAKLIRTPNKLVAHDMLGDRSADTISYLRKSLEFAGAPEKGHIKTERGEGYRLILAKSQAVVVEGNGTLCHPVTVKASDAAEYLRPSVSIATLRTTYLSDPPRYCLRMEVTFDGPREDWRLPGWPWKLSVEGSDDPIIPTFADARIIPRGEGDPVDLVARAPTPSGPHGHFNFEAISQAFDPQALQRRIAWVVPSKPIVLTTPGLSATLTARLPAALKSLVERYLDAAARADLEASSAEAELA